MKKENNLFKFWKRTGIIFSLFLIFLFCVEEEESLVNKRQNIDTKTNTAYIVSEKQSDDYIYILEEPKIIENYSIKKGDVYNVDMTLQQSVEYQLSKVGGTAYYYSTLFDGIDDCFSELFNENDKDKLIESNVFLVSCNAITFRDTLKQRYKNGDSNFLYYSYIKKYSLSDNYFEQIVENRMRAMVEFVINPSSYFYFEQNGKVKSPILCFAKIKNTNANLMNSSLEDDEKNYCLITKKDIEYLMKCEDLIDTNLYIPETLWDTAQEFGINELYILAHAIHETGKGKSELAKGQYVNENGDVISFNDTQNGNIDSLDNCIMVYNFFGYGANDSSEIVTAQENGARYAYLTSQDDNKICWDTPEKAMNNGVLQIYRTKLSKFENLYQMRFNFEGEGQYATDLFWAYNQANIINRLLNHLSDWEDRVLDDGTKCKFDKDLYLNKLSYCMPKFK